MTYDDVRRQDADKQLRSPPWESTPGQFLLQVIPAVADPLLQTASGMMDAIRIARWHYRDHAADAVKLRVTSKDGSEIYQGKL